MVRVGAGRRLASATQPDPELHWNEHFANSSGNASRSRSAHTGAFFWVTCPHRWPTKATRIPASATLLGSPTGLSVSPTKLASHTCRSSPSAQSSSDGSPVTACPSWQCAESRFLPPPLSPHQRRRYSISTSIPRHVRRPTADSGPATRCSRLLPRFLGRAIGQILQERAPRAAGRVGDAADSRLPADALVSAALACRNAAIAHFGEQNGATHFSTSPTKPSAVSSHDAETNRWSFPETACSERRAPRPTENGCASRSADWARGTQLPVAQR